MTNAAPAPACPAKPYRRILVWLRRDLRVDDHAALAGACADADQVFCAFVFDTEILAPLRAAGLTADRRVEFIHHSVAEVDAALRAAGSALLVRHGVARAEIPRLAALLDADAVYLNHDYEPAAVARDAAVAAALHEDGCDCKSFKDQVIFERDEVLTGQGKPFSVFTPYARAWLKRLVPDDLAPRVVPPLAGIAGAVPKTLDTGIPTLAEMGFAPTNLAELALPAGSSGARQLFDAFLQRMAGYRERRDFPAQKGPSYLSVHLRFGTISIRMLVRAAHAAMRAGDAGAQTWLNELIWREFYFQILHHHPRLAQGASFKPVYDAIRWEHGEPVDRMFTAWCDGQTGYPLVDAAMRQLRDTGYMHNRLRMVAACFLIKDLGIDWRRGEAHFAAQLNDFDFAANNGGWQWASSSGCDAQPYFRIFNPVTQSEKFDAEGRFIRRYVPELAALPDRWIHAPWQAPADVLRDAGVTLGVSYPAPLVAHDVARAHTLARYAVVKTPADGSDDA